MNETWKDIEGYEGLYEISNLGRVRKVSNGKLMAIHKDSRGYPNLRLTKNGSRVNHRVHRLVAFAFIKNPNPNELNMVNHIDGDKTNNSIDNLEWSNNSLNQKHAFKKGLQTAEHCRGSNHWKVKLNERQVLEIREKHSTGKYSYTKLSLEYGVGRHAIARIIKRESWKHI